MNEIENGLPQPPPNVFMCEGSSKEYKSLGAAEIGRRIDNLWLAIIVLSVGMLGLFIFLIAVFYKLQ